MAIDPTQPTPSAAFQVAASQSTLDVIRLSPGEDRPEGSDFVQVSRRPSGGYAYGGTVAIHAEDVVAGSATAVSDAVGADGAFATAEAAEAAAIEWAAEQGAETLYLLPAS